MRVDLQLSSKTTNITHIHSVLGHLTHLSKPFFWTCFEIIYFLTNNRNKNTSFTDVYPPASSMTSELSPFWVPLSKSSLSDKSNSPITNVSVKVSAIRMIASNVKLHWIIYVNNSFKAHIQSLGTFQTLSIWCGAYAPTTLCPEFPSKDGSATGHTSPLNSPST